MKRLTGPIQFSMQIVDQQTEYLKFSCLERASRGDHIRIAH